MLSRHCLVLSVFLSASLRSPCSLLASGQDFPLPAGPGPALRGPCVCVAGGKGFGPSCLEHLFTRLLASVFIESVSLGFLTQYRFTPGKLLLRMRKLLRGAGEYLLLPHGRSQSSVNSCSRGCDALSWPLQVLRVFALSAQKRMQVNIHTHKIKCLTWGSFGAAEMTSSECLLTALVESQSSVSSSQLFVTSFRGLDTLSGLQGDSFHLPSPLHTH